MPKSASKGKAPTAKPTSTRKTKPAPTTLPASAPLESIDPLRIDCREVVRSFDRLAVPAFLLVPMIPGREDTAQNHARSEALWSLRRIIAGDTGDIVDWHSSLAKIVREMAEIADILQGESSEPFRAIARSDYASEYTSAANAIPWPTWFEELSRWAEAAASHLGAIQVPMFRMVLVGILDRFKEKTILEASLDELQKYTDFVAALDGFKAEIVARADILEGERHRSEDPLGSRLIGRWREVKSLAAGIRGDAVDAVAKPSLGSASRKESHGEPITPTVKPEELRPRWDDEARELWLGDELVKAFAIHAYAQIEILEAFHGSNWARRIEKPIIDNQKRLSNAVKQLRSNIGHRLEIKEDGDFLLWKAVNTELSIN